MMVSVVGAWPCNAYASSSSFPPFYISRAHFQGVATARGVLVGQRRRRAFSAAAFVLVSIVEVAGKALSVERRVER